MAAVEEELKVRLFERNARARVSLTPEGEALLPLLRRLEEDHTQLLERAGELASPKEQELHLGFPNGWSTLGEDELLLGFHERSP